MFVRSLIVTFAFVGVSTHLPAAVLVIANGTTTAISFTIDRGNGVPDPISLEAGETKPFHVARHANLKYSVATKPTTVRLDAFTAYIFAKEKGALVLRGIDLVGKPIPLGGTPERLTDPPAPLPIKLKLYADDANPFAQAVWEPKLRKRMEKAAAVVSAACGVQFEIVSVGKWKSDPDESTLEKLLTDFEDKVKFEPGVLHVGFTHRIPVKANDTSVTTIGKSLAPFRPHLLIRDGAVKSESEQTELLAHELGHWLGAVTTPDADSVMRTKLGDGRAVLTSFKIRFDPLNTLAMNLWVAERAGGKVKTWQDLKPETQGRLARIYDTLAKADPGEKQCEAITALIAAQNPADAVVVANPNDRPAVERPAGDRPPMAGNPAPNAKPKNTKEEAVRRVLKGISIRALDNAAKPAAERLKGDDLAVQLIKTAADVAMAEDEAMQVPAFAVAIGIGLDDSTILRNNPLTKSLCSSVESEDEFKERTAAISSASLHTRRDLCQHFVVSCALTDLVGPDLAKQAGLAKELQDMKGTSGFSFCDLCVDYGGVEFVERMKKDKHLLSRVRLQFRVKDYVPTIEGLTENLSSTAFTSQFGSIYDPRYKAAVAEIQKRVQSLGGYAK